jgi:hypothetical protein
MCAKGTPNLVHNPSKLASRTYSLTINYGLFRFIKRYMLDPDLKTYGLVNLQSLASVPAAVLVAASITDPTASTSTASTEVNDEDD